jgi:hypothetical protein
LCYRRGSGLVRLVLSWPSALLDIEMKRDAAVAHITILSKPADIWILAGRPLSWQPKPYLIDQFSKLFIYPKA